MANYQNNMRCQRRSAQPLQAAASMPSSAGSCRCRMDGCPDTHDHFPSDMPVAMAYVPWQKWQDLYDPYKGLERGTIFKELDKPFLGKGGIRR